MTTDPVETTASDPRRWKALGVLGLIQFMLILDVTVVNVALPDIQKDLHFSETGLAWVVNGYVLMAGGLLLLGGRLADMIGRKKVFLLGVILFGAASAACGAAVNAEMLVFARFAQGMGEALAAPASLGLIALMFPDPQERIKALGIWGGIAGLGGTSGTVISGFLTELADWRWIFYINLPVAAFALIVVPRLVSESRMERESQHRPDVAGAFTGTAGLIAIVYGLLEAVDHGWGSSNVLVPLLGGLVLIALMVFIESRATDPLIPLSFFRNRTRVVTNFVTLFFAAGFFSYFFLLTLFEQQVLGYSPIEGGLSYLPLGLTIGAGIGFSTAMMPRLGVRTILTAGFLLCAAGLALTSMVSTDTEYVSGILPGMLLLAFGSGISFPAYGNASLHEVTGQDSSLASGVQNAMQQVGGALGLATIVTIALTHAQHQIEDGVLPPEAFTDGFALGWRVAVALLLLGGVLVALLLENVLAVPRNPLAEEVAAEAGPPA
ncbi:MFS transporter [Nocardioides humilatus]|uniref:MFS transporter n=1 Tax=Nocardioides humilatus TaxID=2607660 RepID=A0A5B1L540_9ACTN|nr:MFS transporter [Nocardioides humilatus]KAA1415268.1 MFS transporter [Nocardioides humilatus]